MWQAQSEGQLGTYNPIQSKWRNFLNSNSMEVHTRVKQYRSKFSRIWRTYTAAFPFIFAVKVSTGQIFLSTIPYQHHLRHSSPISSQANPTSLPKVWRDDTTLKKKKERWLEWELRKMRFVFMGELASRSMVEITTRALLLGKDEKRQAEQETRKKGWERRNAQEKPYMSKF